MARVAQGGTDLGTWEALSKGSFHGRESSHLGSLGNIRNAYASPCLQQGWEGRAKFTPSAARISEWAECFPETVQSNGAKFPAEMDDLKGVCCSGNSRKGDKMAWITRLMRKS